MNMATMPTIPAPDGFERDVIVRSALASLPQMSAPEGFDQAVMDRIVHQGRAGIAGNARWWLVASLVTIAVSVASWLYATQTPDAIVRVVPPVIIAAEVDLYDLPPVSVHEDDVATRWSARVKAARRIKDDVVAGR